MRGGETIRRARQRKGLTQSGVGREVGISISTLSRTEHGSRIPSDPEIDRYAAVLDLDSEGLKRAFEEDRIVRVPDEDADILEGTFLDLLEAHAGTPGLINRIWFRGDPELAFSEAEARARQLQAALQRYKSDKRRRPLLRILSKLWFEQACAYYVSNRPYDAYLYFKSACDRQRWAVDQLDDDQEPLGWAFYGLGNAYYALRRYSDSRRWFTWALELVRDEAYRRPLILRTIALNCAYLRDEEGFKVAEAQAKRMLDAVPPTLVSKCIVLEGLGRAQAILRRPEAWDTLRQGWETLAKAEAQGTRLIAPRLELIRSQVEAAVCLEGGDRDLVEHYVHEGRVLAHEHGFRKYEQHMIDLLQQVA